VDCGNRQEATEAGNKHRGSRKKKLGSGSGTESDGLCEIQTTLLFLQNMYESVETPSVNIRLRAHDEFSSRTRLWIGASADNFVPECHLILGAGDLFRYFITPGD
jgi:hypothetical protein